MKLFENVKYLIIIFVLSLLATSCGIFKRTSNISLTEEQKLKNTSEFVDGCKEKILGNYEKASKHFLACAKTDPTNSAVFYELAENYNLQQKTSEAISYIEKALKIENNNEWYLQLYAELLITQQKYKEAASIYGKLAKAHPENIDFYIDWAMCYLYSEKYTEATGIYDLIEQKMGIMEEISLQKEKIYLLQNKFSKAVEEIQGLINAFPAETKYYNYLADLYLSNKMTKEAYDIYLRIIEMEPNNASVHLSLAEYYRTIGQKDKSFEELKLAFGNSNLDIDSKIKILLSYYVLTENSDILKEQAYKLIDLMVKTHPSEAKAYSMYGDFLYRDKKVQEAKEQYLKVIELDSSRYTVWEQLLFLESETNNYKSLDNESKRAIELFPEQAVLYLFNGIANFSLKNYETAISSLNKGISLVVDKPKLLEQFYTYLGDTYYAQQNYNEAFSSYNKVLSLNPQNVYILNNYSYYLALRNENLENAEKMAKKAVTINPGSSSYLDTYAWVLFKLNKFGEAETWINKAIDAGGNSNPVILEHAGDILFKLGQAQKSVEFWIKAKEKGKASELLEKKINDKKLYE